MSTADPFRYGRGKCRAKAGTGPSPTMAEDLRRRLSGIRGRDILDPAQAPSEVHPSGLGTVRGLSLVDVPADAGSGVLQNLADGTERV